MESPAPFALREIFMGYWASVSKGTWTITDPTDAIDALKDWESRAVFDKKNNRINVMGPAGKSLIINLREIYKLLPDQELTEFVGRVERLLNQAVT